MRENNVDLLVDKILKDGAKMTPERIEAFSKVISSLAGHNTTTHEPNAVQDDANAEDLSEDVPVDFSEVEGVQFGSTGTKKKVKIIKAE